MQVIDAAVDENFLQPSVFNDGVLSGQRDWIEVWDLDFVAFMQILSQEIAALVGREKRWTFEAGNIFYGFLAGSKSEMHLAAADLALGAHVIKGGGKAESKFFKQQFCREVGCDLHGHWMAFIEDIQAQEGILKKLKSIGRGLNESVFDKADSLVLKIDAEKTLFLAAFDDTGFFEFKAFNKIIPLQQGDEQDSPPNEEYNSQGACKSVG